MVSCAVLSIAKWLSLTTGSQYAVVSCALANELQAKPDPLVMDVIGAGEDLAAIQGYAASKGLVWNWMGGKDHADPSMHDYQVNGVRLLQSQGLPTAHNGAFDNCCTYLACCVSLALSGVQNPYHK
jgi:hypothetical protein